MRLDSTGIWWRIPSVSTIFEVLQRRERLKQCRRFADRRIPPRPGTPSEHVQPENRAAISAGSKSRASEMRAGSASSRSIRRVVTPGASSSIAMA